VTNDVTDTETIDTETLKVPPREHRDGCPALRTETFPSRSASGPAAVVVRCVDCGGQAVYEKGDANAPHDR